VAYRRGFKTEANSIATEVRGELNLTALDALDPWALAAYLCIPVWPLSSLEDDAKAAIQHLRDIDQGAFSAVTVFCGTKRTIVHNDGHVRGRQVSDVAHELSHGLLQHPPTPALDDRGCRDWNEGIEDEAQWLAGALLITEDAALWIARGNASEDEAAARFGVTRRMVHYRLNVTGARTRVARARKFRVV
jgi:Zn-dependent peptidase ImmA (M78 family)